MSDQRTREYRKLQALSAQKKALEKGKWPFSCPFGYKRINIGYKKIINKDNTRNVGIKIRTLKVNDLQLCSTNSLIIEELFNRYASGLYSYESLLKYMKEKFNVPWGQSHIQKLLENKFYIGEMHFDGKIYLHTYGNIISKELFEKANFIKELKLNKRSARKNNTFFCYRGIIFCSLCKVRAFSPEQHKGHFYYHCANKKLHAKQFNTKEETFTYQFMELLSSMIINKEFLESLSCILKSKLEIFLNNFQEWFLKNKKERKRLLLFLTSKIYFNGKNIELVFKAPFNNTNFQEFSWFDLDEILKIFNPQHISIIDQPIINNSHKILNLLQNKKTTNTLFELLEIDFIELQNLLTELQLDGKIDQDSLGFWKIK